jgi:CheY-like chemotaxis protein
VENFRDKNLLVIDDDEYNILLCHTILKRWGIHPDLASNGKEGIRMISENKYDLILTDVQMPEVSGLELLDFVRQAEESKNKTTPVVVLSANVMPEIKEKFDQKGAHIFVNKPFRELELVQAVAKALHMEEEISEVAEDEDMPEIKSNDTGINLDQIKKFAENDPSALIAILEGILQSNQNNLHQLKDFKQQEDWKSIASTAHKMIPSFAHLGAVEISPLLRKLEKSEKLISGQKEKDLKLLLEKLEPILNELQYQVEALKATEKVKV